MKLAVITLVLSVLLPQSVSLECSKHDLLKKYKLDRYSITNSVVRDTPPSKTNETWWINVCEENKAALPPSCREGDVLCGITEVLLPGEKPILTQAIDFPKSLSSQVSENEQNELVVELKGTSWGSNTIDAHLTYVCDAGTQQNTVETTTWQDKQIRLRIKGPSGCLKGEGDDDGGDNGNGNGNGNDKDKDKDKHKDPAEKKSGGGILSWFTWLIVYALLFALVYLVATSYLNTRGGTLADFREEFVDRSTNLAASLPEFTREMVGKIFNGRPSAQRGGYSAV